jgi:hypothetical protein
MRIIFLGFNPNVVNQNFEEGTQESTSLKHFLPSLLLPAEIATCIEN